MVDYSSGETAVTSEYLSHMKNAISIYNDFEKDIYFPTVLDKFVPANFIETIASHNKLVELISAPGEFDGASGIGGIPFTINSSQVTETEIYDGYTDEVIRIETSIVDITSDTSKQYEIMDLEKYQKFVSGKWVKKNMAHDTQHVSLGKFISTTQVIMEHVVNINDRFNTPNGKKLGFLLGKLANIVGIMNVPPPGEEVFDDNGKQITHPTIESSIFYIYNGVNKKVQDATKESFSHRVLKSRKPQTSDDGLFQEIAVNHPSIFTINDTDHESSNLVITRLHPNTAYEEYISVYVARLGMDETAALPSESPSKQKILSYLYDVLFYSIQDFDTKYSRFIATYSPEITIDSATAIFLEQDNTDTVSSETSAKIGAETGYSFISHTLDNEWKNTVSASLNTFKQMQKITSACSTSSFSGAATTPTRSNRQTITDQVRSEREEEPSHSDADKCTCGAVAAAAVAAAAVAARLHEY